MKNKEIQIPKSFFKKLKCKIKLPTIKCNICGEEILDTPTNRMSNFINNLTIKNQEILDYYKKK